MSWEVVEMRSFLSERKGRFKPNDKAIMGLKRIEKIDFSGNIYLSEKASKTDMILIKQGDLVISGINVEKGAMSIYKGEEDVVATIHYSSYEYNLEKIDLNFLRHFLKSSEFLEALKEQVPGGIKTEIKPKHILPLKVCIPTNVKEQREVVEYLDKQNNTIETQSTELTHQLDLVKQLRQSFLREAMQGKLVPQDRNDEPASVLLENIKAEKERLIKEKKIKKQKPLPPITEEEIPFDIPENWVWSRLGELYDIVRGSSPRPKGDPRYWSKSRTPFHWITIADFTPFGSNGGLNDTKGFLTELGSTQSRIVKSGDLLIACSGVGSVGRSIETKIDGFIYDGLLAIRSINDKTIKEMIRYFLKFKEDQIYSVASGANWLNINIEILSNYLFPLPPLSEQQRIVAKLDELMQYCDDLEASIKESQQQNELLLQQVLREALEPKEREVVE